MATKDWEKIGTISKHLADMYGKKGSPNVIYIDNWTRGSYALILGIEHKATKKYFARYEEKEVLGNFINLKEAKQSSKEYRSLH
jgi:hypothetical protein